MKTLTIIVPCYNESLNIPLIINRFKEAVGQRPGIEVFLVNNGSTDNSAQILSDAIAQKENHLFKVVTIPVNQGYGYGILKGLEEAKSDILAWTHADMQTDPQDVIRGLDLFLKNSNDKTFIKGKRKNRRILEAFFTFGMQIFALFAIKTYLDDINAQPKIFSRKFYQEYLLGKAPHDFSLDLFALLMAKKNNYDLQAFPVFFAKRHAGEAKGGGSWKTRIKLIKRTVAYILELRKRQD